MSPSSYALIALTMVPVEMIFYLIRYDSHNLILRSGNGFPKDPAGPMRQIMVSSAKNAKCRFPADTGWIPVWGLLYIDSESTQKAEVMVAEDIHDIQDHWRVLTQDHNVK